MLSIWRTQFPGQILLKVFALTATWTCCSVSRDINEINLKPSNSSDIVRHNILIAPDDCLNVEQYGLNELSFLNTADNCLELWSHENCNGTVVYYISSGDGGVADIPWENYPSKSVKLCEPSRQPSHRIFRRGLVENSAEYYFWAVFSKIRGRAEIFFQEFRKGSGHPDWETVLGGRNWQGPRSKMYLKALYKVVNVFKTYCDMDMKWSRYTTEELAKVKQLAADVVKLRERKALKFPYNDPQSQVHARIVAVWKNITITLDKAYDLKVKYDQSVKLDKLSNVSSTTVLGSSDSSSVVPKVDKEESTVETTKIKVTLTTISTKSKRTSVTDPPDKSYIKILD